VTVKKPIEKKNFDAKGDEYKLNEDSVFTVNAAKGVLDNDRGPAGVTLQARVVEGPEHGKLVFNADGSFTYVPDRDFHGKDSFWYEFTDGNNVSRAVEVKLNVKDVKDKHPRCIDWDDDWNRSPWNDCFMPFGKRWR
jgi:VCBS repeat-containing protein